MIVVLLSRWNHDGGLNYEAQIYIIDNVLRRDCQMYESEKIFLGQCIYGYYTILFMIRVPRMSNFLNIVGKNNCKSL